MITVDMVIPLPSGGSLESGIPPISNDNHSIPLTSSFQAELHPLDNGIFTNYAPHIPFSHRRAPPLDLSTVERRGPSSNVRESRRVRPHGLQEAPTFRPTEEEFKDPFEYIKKIRAVGEKYGICKIIPPDSWDPGFAIDTERFFFKTRRQELNSVEGGTRTNNQYLDQLARFHKQHGMSLNRFPSVDKRPLDLYKLKKAVETRGGFEKVCKLKKWAEIGRDLGYSGKIMSSLSTSLKNSYQKWLHPYEEFLKIAKPGVQQQLEFENGGPFTPNSGHQSMKGSFQDTPTSIRDSSPALRASAALNASIHDIPDPLDKIAPIPEAPRPVISSGFTPVNSGGFTAVNALPPAPVTYPSPSQSSTKDEFGLGQMVPNRGPARLPSELPDYLQPPGIPNGHSASPSKRSLSHESTNRMSTPDIGVGGEGDDGNERRSKRAKKGTLFCPSSKSLPFISHSLKKLWHVVPS